MDHPDDAETAKTVMMGRRLKLNMLIAINGIGCLLCGTALGGIAKAGVIPWYGISGIACLFLGILVPMYREFMGLRDGFDSVQREAMRSIKQRRGDKNYQEVFDDRQRITPFKRVANQDTFVLAFTIAGWSLLAIEAFIWVTRG